MKKYKLGELLDVTRGASLSGEYYSTEGEFIRLTLGNFDYQNGGFKENTSKDDLFFTGTVKPQFILNEGDIITPLTEQTQGLIGSTARIPQSGVYIQSQDVGLVKCNGELLDPDFCYYLLPSQIVKKQLSAGAQQTKIRHTSPDKIKDVTVFLPELSEQRKIGHILRSIDSQIDNLTAINRNLEQVARQLYDYWFVQFDFPNSEGKPYKSSGGNMAWNEQLKAYIPREWSVSCLEDVFDIIMDRCSNAEQHTHYTPIEVIPRKQMSLNETAPIENAISGLCSYKKNDILLSNRRVYFHKVCIAPFDGITRDTVIVLRPKQSSYLGFLFQLVFSEHFISYATLHSYGSEQPVLSWQTVKRYKFATPDVSLIRQYCNLANDIINQVIDNHNQIRHLKSLRDELLPMLLNGQVNCDLSK